MGEKPHSSMTSSFSCYLPLEHQGLFSLLHVIVLLLRGQSQTSSDEEAFAQRDFGRC